MTQSELQTVLKGIAAPLKEQFAARDARIACLERQVADLLIRPELATKGLLGRVEALERKPSLQYRGVYEAGKTYQPGDFVTWSGSCWCALEVTKTQPNFTPDSAKSWTLAVKEGRPGRDAKR